MSSEKRTSLGLCQVIVLDCFKSLSALIEPTSDLMFVSFAGLEIIIISLDLANDLVSFETIS